MLLGLSPEFHCWFWDRLEMHQMPKERADQEHIPETQLDQALPERLVHCKNAGNSCKKKHPRNGRKG